MATLVSVCLAPRLLETLVIRALSSPLRRIVPLGQAASVAILSEETELPGVPVRVILESGGLPGDCLILAEGRREIAKARDLGELVALVDRFSRPDREIA